MYIYLLTLINGASKAKTCRAKKEFVSYCQLKFPDHIYFVSHPSFIDNLNHKEAEPKPSLLWAGGRVHSDSYLCVIHSI